MGGAEWRDFSSTPFEQLLLLFSPKHQSTLSDLKWTPSSSSAPRSPASRPRSRSTPREEAPATASLPAPSRESCSVRSPLPEMVRELTCMQPNLVSSPPSDTRLHSHIVSSNLFVQDGSTLDPHFCDGHPADTFVRFTFVVPWWRTSAAVGRLGRRGGF